jgi:predicted transcriptional regulator
MSDETNPEKLMEATVDVVRAYVSNNRLDAVELPSFIRQVHDCFRGLGNAQAEHGKAEPHVPIKRSVTRNYLVCLECGMQLKMLKRHMGSAHQMSLADYRTKWGLPPSYPVVAPSYAETRSALAKEIGLGTRNRRKGGRRKRA